MKSRVVDKGVPCLQEHGRRSGHDAPPLLGAEQHADKNNSGRDESVHVDEVPNARNADSVPVSGSPYNRRDIARIILRSPNAVVRDLKRRKTYPFAPWRTAVIEIETRMIKQNR